MQTRGSSRKHTPTWEEEDKKTKQLGLQQQFLTSSVVLGEYTEHPHLTECSHQLLFPVCEGGSTSRVPSPSIPSPFLLLLLKMYYSSCCQNSVEKYHKESEQFILQLTNLAALIAPPDTKDTDFSQQNALLQNPNDKTTTTTTSSSSSFSCSSQKRQSTESQPELLQAPPKQKKKPLKNTKKKAKNKHTNGRERKPSGTFYSPSKLRAAEAWWWGGSSSFFSFFSFRRQQTKRKKKKPTQNKFTQESKLQNPPLPTHNSKCKRQNHLWENTKLGVDEN